MVDIAERTSKVGNALTSVRIENMILELAKGIAWGQYELDKAGVEITKLMGVPGTVSIGGEKLSMLEAGFIPSFYHFVDTILEIKMDISIREEQADSTALKMSQSGSSSTEVTAEASAKFGVNAAIVSAEVGVKAGYKATNTSAYSRSLDASHSQKFSQDLSASSLMRTKIVPVPAPELLVERIKILLDQLRKKAEAEAKDDPKNKNLSEEDLSKKVEELLMDKVKDKILGRVLAKPAASGGTATGGTATGGTATDTSSGGTATGGAATGGAATGGTTTGTP